MLEVFGNILLLLLIIFGVYVFIVVIALGVGMIIDIWQDNDYYE